MPQKKANSSDDALPAYSASSESSSRSSKKSRMPAARAEEGSTVIERAIDELDGDLRGLSLDISDHPETALKEFRTHDTLVTFMKSHGFDVTPHAYDMETAWKAEYTHVSSKAGAAKKGRTLGFNSEMDALPTIGHGCGHNLIAIVGVGAALATARALNENDVSGKVILLGTPAEEDIGGKITLIKRGAYKPMDVCLMAHGAPKGWSGFAPLLAIQDVEVEYTGRGAHSAQAPWQGVNALVLAYSNVSALRQQIKPDERVHGVIRDRQGWAVNIVPASSVLEYGIRSPSLAGLLALKNRVYACFKAAAEATGCEVKIKEAYAYFDVRNCEPMADAYTSYMEDRAKRKQDHITSMIGSTDFGNVCYELPAIHPTFNIACPDGLALHTKEFRDQARTPEAHKEALHVAKALATVAYRIATDDNFHRETVDWYKQDEKERKKSMA